MKFAVLFLLLLFSNTGCTDRAVYICDSRNAIRYHNRPDCRGLSNCTYRIIPIKEGEAKKMGRTLCHLEK